MVLVEASGVLGGMVRRHTVAGIDLDMAADSFATRTDAISRLAIELGLGNDIVTPDQRGAWLMTRDGRTAPIPATGLLGIPSTPMAADVLAVIGQKGRTAAQMDSLLPSPVGAKAASLGELVRKRMGERVLDDLVVPIAGGVHSTHPDRLDPDRVAPGCAPRCSGTARSAARCSHSAPVPLPAPPSRASAAASSVWSTNSWRTWRPTGSTSGSARARPPSPDTTSRSPERTARPRRSWPTTSSPRRPTRSARRRPTAPASSS